MSDKELVEHYKIYYKAWQRARAMIKNTVDDKTLSKEEKKAIQDIYNIMTVAIDDEVGKLGG